MSRRRERSRSPVHRRERERHDKGHHERSNKPSSYSRSKDDFHKDMPRQRRDDRHHPRQEHVERQRRQSPDRRPRGNRERESGEEDDRRSTNTSSSEMRDRREETRDFRQDRDQNEDRRDNRRPPHNRRDRRREREEEEPEDTSRYGQPADGGDNDNTEAVPAEEPNFGLSGKLTGYSNTYKGVVIKYNEPPEARKPKTRWRLYPFKGEEGLPVLYIHRQSAYLMGRQRHIADIPIDHPSCSKQHAVLQYRLADFERSDGTKGRKAKPFILDLESANGTYLNNERIDPRRYYELKERDVLKFGFSSREYVMLHEKSLNAGGNAEGSGADSGSEESPE